MVGRWFSLGTLVSPNIKTDRHDITEILLNKFSYKNVPVDKYYKYLLNGAKVSPFNFVVCAIFNKTYLTLNTYMYIKLYTISHVHKTILL